MLTLKDVLCEQTARVVRLEGSGAVRRRVMDMGLTKGTEVFVRKSAPLGDPLELNIRGYELSLRKEDAGMVVVELVDK
ncbi:MAG: ferrous iron transport protein A [Synergistaceae bacterium]|jgi:ferrous iron transport protein A|nr:ferrous iron transport protein A [Synergistaceae bacterium]